MTPYKGWSSYETWLAKVWLDNEPLTKHYWQIAVRDTWATATGSHICTRSDRACVELAQRLKLERQAAANELLRQVDATMSFWADLIHREQEEHGLLVVRPDESIVSITQRMQTGKRGYERRIIRTGSLLS